MGTLNLDELLAHPTVGLATRVFQIRDDVHGVAVRRVVDRGDRQCNHRTALAQCYFYLDEHSGMQFAAWIRERRLDLNIPSGRVHDRVYSRDAPGKLLAF